MAGAPRTTEDRGPDSPGLPMGWLPVLVALGVVVITLLLWDALAQAERERLDADLASRASRIAAELAARMEARVLVIDRIAERWIHSDGITYDEFTFSARLNVQDYPGIVAIEWADPEGRVQWVGPEEGNLGVLGADLSTEPRRARALERARATGRPALTEAVPLLQGSGRGVLVVAPLDTPDGFQGYVVGVIRLSELVRQVAAEEIGEAYGLAVLRKGQEQVRIEAGSPELEAQWGTSAPLDLMGSTWTLRIWPDPAALSRLRSALADATLAGGLLLALMVGMALHNSRLARDRARALERANAELQRENAVRRAAELEAAQAAADLARSNRDLEQFAYAASHDLQEPLRVVAGYVQLLDRRYGDQLQGAGKTYVRHAVEGVQRMQRLIADLLAYARIGARRPTQQAVDAGAVLREAVADLGPRLEEADGEVTWEQLPELLADAGLLRQLFQNLLGNAVKYRSEAPPRIHVSAVRLGEQWELSVRDNGIGIDPAHHAQIFDVFARLHGREEFEGTGIGLAVCKRIVEAHGGRILVDSRPGEGAVFRFTLPAATPGPEADDGTVVPSTAE